MNVGVRELKQNLSKYIEIAADGDTVVVTDRGIPKAMLCPLRPDGDLDLGMAEGWVTPPRRHAQHGLTPFTATPSQRTTADVLDEDRGDS